MERDAERDNHSKAHKPLIERRRRERINRSLDELKSLVLNSLNRDERDYSRMEKADILEMAVRFLRGIHQSEKVRQTSSKYMAGFNHCAANVMWYVNRSPDMMPQVRLQLLQRLAMSLQRVHTQATYEPSDSAYNKSHTPTVYHHDVVTPYDVTPHTVHYGNDNTQDEVYDLSMKGSPVKAEDDTGWERKMAEGTPLYDRYRDLSATFNLSREMIQTTHDVSRIDGNGVNKGSERQQFFQNDGVWRPF